MGVQIREIVQNFPDLLDLVRSPREHDVSDLQTGATATTRSLIFVSNATQLKEAAAGASRTWVVSKELLEHVPAEIPAVLVSPSPALALAQVAKRHFPQTRSHQPIAGPEVHDSARVSASARIGADCIIGPGAVIGDECTIGDNCIIGANSVLEPGVKVGAGTHIHPLVFIGHSCEIGSHCEIHPHTTIGTEGFGYAQDKEFNHHRITHYGRVVIEDHVHIGAGVQIDRGTFEDSRIGAGTKIDNHCHFGHNIRIGKNTLITGGMITAGSVTIGSRCVFGGRTSIKGHLSVADGAHFGGLSGITGHVTEAGEYGGFPLQPLRDEMRTRAALKELPRLIKQVRRILKHLGLSKEA